MVMAADIKTDGQPVEIDSPAPLTPLETEVIDLFVELARTLSQPRSAAEIYGLLFVSAKPLAMDDLIQRLEMSKGSASMGLKLLRNVQAVKTVYVPGDRRTHYEAVAELRNLAVNYLKNHIVPHLDSGVNRLDKIDHLIKKLPESDRKKVQNRVTMLQSWEKRSRQFLSVVVRFLGN